VGKTEGEKEPKIKKGNKRETTNNKEHHLGNNKLE
jgi:hypothetical protein